MRSFLIFTIFFIASVNAGVIERKAIAGGNYVSAGIYPWVVRVIDDRSGDWQRCSGTLISREYFLTTIDCVVDYGSRDDDNSIKYSFQIGALCGDFIEGENCGQSVEERQLLEYFPDDKSSSGLALVRFSDPVTGPNLGYAHIDSRNIIDDYDYYTNLWAMGFGKFDDTGDDDGVPHLQHVQLQYIDNAECDSYIFGNGQGGRVKDDEMCVQDTVTENGNQGTCAGDQGGPLYDSDIDQVVAVAKKTSSCPGELEPSVFIRIAPHFEWIKQIMCDTFNHGNPLPEFCFTQQPSMAPSQMPSTSPSHPPSQTPSQTFSQAPSQTPSTRRSGAKGKGKNSGYRRPNSELQIEQDNQGNSTLKHAVVYACSCGAVGLIIMYGIYTVSRRRRSSRESEGNEYSDTSKDDINFPVRAENFGVWEQLDHQVVGDSLAVHQRPSKISLSHQFTSHPSHEDNEQSVEMIIDDAVVIDDIVDL